MEQQLLTTQEAADMLNVSLRTVCAMIARRDIAYLKVGGQYRIAIKAVELSIKANTVTPRLIADQVA
jgi:excisionase family DNA binding protein